MSIIAKIRGGIRAAIFFVCLAAVLAFAVRSAVAHSPQAVDAQGNACIQVDCAGDKITNRCNFPVQLISQCKGGGSLCIITGAFNSETAGTAGKVKVLGARNFGTEWERALLRDTDFYPKDISRTNISGGGREQFFRIRLRRSHGRNRGIRRGRMAQGRQWKLRFRLRPQSHGRTGAAYCSPRPSGF